MSDIDAVGEMHWCSRCLYVAWNARVNPTAGEIEAAAAPTLFKLLGYMLLTGYKQQRLLDNSKLYFGLQIYKSSLLPFKYH